MAFDEDVLHPGPGAIATPSPLECGLRKEPSRAAMTRRRTKPPYKLCGRTYKLEEMGAGRLHGSFVAAAQRMAKSFSSTLMLRARDHHQPRQMQRQIRTEEGSGSTKSTH